MRAHSLTALSLLLIRIIAQIDIYVIFTPIVAPCFLPPLLIPKDQDYQDCSTGFPLPSN